MTNDMVDMSIKQLEELLNDFDPKVRKAALVELSERIASGQVQPPAPKPEVNLHYHTFFSFNAYGWSPSRVAWEARKYGLLAAGIVDFDVFDGMEEFLRAGEIVGIRATAAMETRVFIPEYADQVLSSPNEPGIGYFMAGGCYRLPEAGTESARTLEDMREMALRRNLQVMERVNEYLDRVRLDYQADILPLTPAGNATERHMLAAYDAKAREVFDGDNAGLVSFWADALGMGTEDAAKLLDDTPALHEKMRSKLMKFGGVGYVPPSADTFPDVSRVIEMTQGMDALPTMTWLDGTNPGESDMPALLGMLAKKGTAVLNIVPDRNWNVRDPEDKAIKVANLAKAVGAARDLQMPLCVGTELNKLGLPFVDDFSAPELQPYVADFLEGAYFLWGHTVLARHAGIGWASDWAEAQFGSDRVARNAFYSKIGRLADPRSAPDGVRGIEPSTASPADVIKALG